jgi:hypothetical protein
MLCLLSGVGATQCRKQSNPARAAKVNPSFTWIEQSSACDIGLRAQPCGAADPRFVRKYPHVEVPLQLSVIRRRGPTPSASDGEEAYGVWRLTSGHGKSATIDAVTTRGNLKTNDGEIAVIGPLMDTAS